MDGMCEYGLMNSNERTKSKTGGRTWLSPDVAFCRARRFGVSDVVFCLMSDAQNCGFAVGFERSFFCLHPQREKIIAQTKAKPA
jgi:hypothetical protein